MDVPEDAAGPEAVGRSYGSAVEAGHTPVAIDADGHPDGFETPSRSTMSSKLLSKHQSRKKEKGLGTFFGLPEQEV